MKTSKDNLFMKIAGICGILAPIIAFICIIVVVLLSPWFSWTENWLSDLGGFPGDEPTWSAHGISSILFNLGLVIAGALGICLALGIRKSRLLNTSLGNVGIFIFFLDSCTLIGIGVFPETTGSPHTFFSIIFFFMAGLTLFLVGISLIKTSEWTLGIFTIALFILGLTSVPFFLIPRPIGSNAVAEMIPIISIAAFSIVFGFELIKRASMNNDYEE